MWLAGWLAVNVEVFVHHSISLGHDGHVDAVPMTLKRVRKGEVLDILSRRILTGRKVVKPQGT